MCRLGRIGGEEERKGTRNAEERNRTGGESAGRAERGSGGGAGERRKISSDGRHGAGRSVESRRRAAANDLRGFVPISKKMKNFFGNFSKPP